MQKILLKMNSFVVYLAVVVAILSSLPTNSCGSVLRLKSEELTQAGEDEVRPDVNRETRPSRHHHHHHRHSNKKHTVLKDRALEKSLERLTQNLDHARRGPRGRRQSDFHMFRRQTQHHKRFMKILTFIQTYGMPSSERQKKYDQCVLDGIKAYGRPKDTFLDLCKKLKLKKV